MQLVLAQLTSFIFRQEQQVLLESQHNQHSVFTHHHVARLGMVMAQPVGMQMVFTLHREAPPRQGVQVSQQLVYM
jgi:hypothetical protein